MIIRKLSTDVPDHLDFTIRATSYDRQMQVVDGNEASAYNRFIDLTGYAPARLELLTIHKRDLRNPAAKFRVAEMVEICGPLRMVKNTNRLIGRPLMRPVYA